MTEIETRAAVDLTDVERADHERDEQIIERGLATFIEVGSALLRIRERRSYVLSHPTFAEYLAERWEIGQHYAYELMDGAAITSTITEAGLVAPPNARVAFALRPLRDDPDELISTWRRILDEHGERPVTRQVIEVVRELRPSQRSPRPAPPEEPPDLTRSQERLLAALDSAEHALTEAQSVAQDAAREARIDQAQDWSERLNAIAGHVRAVRSPIGRRLKSVPRRPRSG